MDQWNWTLLTSGMGTALHTAGAGLIATVSVHDQARGQTAGLCTLATLFERGSVHRSQPALYTPLLELAF